MKNKKTLEIWEFEKKYQWSFSELRSFIFKSPNLQLFNIFKSIAWVLLQLGVRASLAGRDGHEIHLLGERPDL